MIRNSILLVIAMLLMVACKTEEIASHEEERRPHAREMSAPQKERCIAEGGRVVEGLAGQSCAQKTKDAGQSCSDSSECETFCIATQTGGQCAPLKPYFGCHQVLQDGLKFGLCVD